MEEFVNKLSDSALEDLQTILIQVMDDPQFGDECLKACEKEVQKRGLAE